MTKHTTLTHQEQEQTLQAAQNLLSLERQALERLEKGIVQDQTALFDALERIKGCKGKVVLTGMGKSGLIASKIAATFASTGTPAFFVHPGEASHGDLGMVTPSDIVIALSNSGETKELFPFFSYCRRRTIPLVVITREKTSTLALSAEVVLLTPNLPEGCPLGLAPTTSTLAALAIGDALAASMMALRGFEDQDFGLFHPSGQLGQRLLLVRERMHVDEALPLVQRETSLAEALITLTAKRLGGVLVVDQNNYLEGLFSDGDLRRLITKGNLDLTTPLSHVMQVKPSTIQDSAFVGEALSIMQKYSITFLPVLDDQRKVVGFLHIHDCLKIQ